MSVSQHDWSLHRKGQIDQERHKEKIREAIKKNLQDIVSEEGIILSDGKKTVRVPIRSLDEYRFRFDPGRQQHAGQGNGKSKVGDVVAQEPRPGKGKKGDAGKEAGYDYYEAEITMEELAAMIFEDLGLPNLEQKRQQELQTEAVRFTDVRKKGPLNNLDKKRTIMENLKRNAAKGEAKFQDIKSEDLRFKVWEPTIRYQSNAVVIAMMDVSGCHTAGHHIEMADGSYKDVSEIIEGDEVACLDLATLQKTTAPVVETFSKIANETLVIETEDATLRATAQHRYFVYDEQEHALIEKRAGELQIGDKLILINSWGSTAVQPNVQLTEDQAYILGALLGDGHIYVSPNSSYITITDENLLRLQQYQTVFERAFNVKGLIRQLPGPNSRQRIHFNSAPLARKLLSDYPMLGSRSRYRYIEASIYREAPEVRAAFLRGLFDAEGSIAHHAVMFYSASRQLIMQVKHLLSYWGIRARVHDFEQHENRLGDDQTIRAGTYYKLSINAKDVLLFAEHIGFGCEEKRAKMKVLVEKQAAGIDAMRSKYILNEDRRERFAHVAGHTRLYTYYRQETHTLSQQQLRTLASSSTATVEDKEYIDTILKRSFIVSKVQRIQRIEEPVQVYDFGVAEHHNYIVDGMLSHNSMGEFEKYIARSFYFWMVRFLRTKYNNVQIVFISHHTEAKEVTEEEFFHKGESGGTQVSSAYELALEIIKERYNPDDWNIYPFHFSDGDNLPWDNDRCVQLVNKLMELCNIFGYGEIREGHYRSPSTLMSAYNKITDKKFIAVTISDKKEVYPALRKFFAQREPVPTR
ncbi:MAG TPA: DUF444 family protein [Ktedonobacteraceae bacterium]|nr:DUF444 family protein [Ktedonobacteraceae bacterium]